MQRRSSQALDGIASFLGRLVIRSGAAAENTLAQLDAYRGRTVEELFPAPPGLPDVTVARAWKVGPFESLHLSFPSEYQPIAPDFRQRHGDEYRRNQQVSVRWIRHTRGGPRPTLIFLHSWMQPDTALEELTMLPVLAGQLGLHVARLDLPYHGRRKPLGSRFGGEYFWTADLVRTVEAIGQSVWDTRRLVSWLSAQEGAPVGIMGLSLGGMMALYTACADPRLAFAIGVAAHLDLAGVLGDASILKRMRGELESHGWSPADVSAYMALVGIADLKPVIPPQRILLVAGKYDRLLSADRTEALWKRWGEPPIHWFPAGHLGIFTQLPGTIAVVRRFLEGLGLGRSRRNGEAGSTSVAPTDPLSPPFNDVPPSA
ncbi:MAG: alpha/beta hydrolase family protein [Deltaproteobacteria bacterium]|nr:alpha/beta hydrolase family protein [Deltaproteobacteria bacterium]